MKTLVKQIDGFDIYFEALEEFNYDFDYMEEEDRQIICEQIDTGALVLFCAKVTADKAGIELASDYLGGCIYENEQAFYTTYENDYFADMVKNVLAEARVEALELIQGLQS